MSKALTRPVVLEDGPRLRCPLPARQATRLGEAREAAAGRGESIAFAFAWLVGTFLVGAPAAAAPDVCAGKGTALVMTTSDSTLSLCDRGTTTKRFRVSVGREGAGKSKRGDLKTPLGAYTLGAPRKSKEFGIFIPLGYPTPEQRRQGYSGQDVGIHGPKRSFRWAGRANVWFDWTAGCVAVATDAEIGEIAVFVRRAKVSRVLIE